MNKQVGGGGEGLDEPTVAFYMAASQVSSGLLRGDELRTRDMVLRCAGGVIHNLLRTMRYPRDVGLIAQLVELNGHITSHLDGIVLNASSEDPALQKLRELAEQRITWVTMVRPGDHKFTDTKLGNLKVGNKASMGSLPKRASLATGANRLTRRLIGDLTNWAECVLYYKDYRNGVLKKKTQDEVHRDLLVFGLGEQKHAEYVKILKRVERSPFSAKTLSQWSGILADYVLFQGPERFTELKALLKNQDNVGQKRSVLQKFFHPALEHLAPRAGR